MHWQRIISHTISQNVIANVLRTGIQLGVAIAGNYWIVRIIDAKTYGAWILVYTVASFLNFIDISLSTALIRFIAADGKSRHYYFWTVWWFYVGAGCLGMSILLVLFQMFSHFFFPALIPELQLQLLALLSAFIALLGSATTNALIGLQKMKRSSFIEVSKSILFYIILFPNLEKMGIYAFAISQLVANFAGLGLSWFLLSKAAPFPVVSFHFDYLIKMSRFGLQTYLIQGVSILKFAVLKMIVSRYYPLEFVTYLELAQKVAGYLRMFLSSLMTPLLPASAVYQSQEKYHRIRTLLSHAFLASSTLALFGATVTIFISPTLIPLWLGNEYESMIVFTQWAAMAVFFNMLSGTSFSILQGIHRLKPLMITAVVGLGFYLLLPYLGGRYISALAVMQGYTFAEAIINTAFMIWLLTNRSKLI